ncbi:MAG: metallophosphoesterase family protein [Clostridia bacterium]|jgi:putative phosphoesterase|nr:metallophosphoesterase family protein [Clostridiales bacterium]
MKVIGIISDTHGLLREEAIHALKGVDLIIHAGDIGSRDIIEKLEEIALVKAVRGNCDRGKWAAEYPVSETVRMENKKIYVLHDLKMLDIDLREKGIDIVISGHSHRAKEERKDGILYINPGSAGPRRFNLPVSVARITIGCEVTSARLINLNGAAH